MSFKDIIRARDLYPLPSRVFTVLGARAGANIYDQPDPTLVFGIDTSHWTGVVDWQTAKAAGIRFTIIKILDGKLVSRFAEENYKGTMRAGRAGRRLSVALQGQPGQSGWAERASSWPS